MHRFAAVCDAGCRVRLDGEVGQEVPDAVGLVGGAGDVVVQVAARPALPQGACEAAFCRPCSVPPASKAAETVSKVCVRGPSASAGPGAGVTPA